MTRPRPLVVVTGGSGFVGGAIADALRRAGHQVEVLGRGGPDHVVDLGTATVADLRRAVDGADALVHAAALTSGDGQAMDRVNVRGTVRLVEAAAATPARRLVLVSSTGRYGPRPGPVVTETTPAAPRSPYERSKALAEDHVLAIGASGLLSTASVQPSIVLGGRGRAGLVTRLAAAARHGLPLPGRASGAVLSAVALEAVAAGVVRLVESDDGGAFILSQPIPWSVVYERIGADVGRAPRTLPAALGRPLGILGDRVRRLPFSSEAAIALSSTTTYSADRAVAALGYQPADPVTLLDRELHG